MGTKRTIAPHVREIAQDLRPGPFLDLFCGMCSVASSVGTTRQIWLNDVSHFASTVAEALFTSNVQHSILEQSFEMVHGFFVENFSCLYSRFRFSVEVERSALQAACLQSVQFAHATAPHPVEDKDISSEITLLRSNSKEFPYRLFTLTYSGTYFSIEQCLEIDSLRYAIDQAAGTDHHVRSWLLMLLAQALSKCANTTGHFAQYISLSDDNFRRQSGQLRRSIYQEFLIAKHSIPKYGSDKWRIENRVTRQDAISLLQNIKRNDAPAVIYADPPYTEDQYSRYYHLLETLVRYDYPSTTHKARYRPDRFVSSFSLKTQALQSIDKLAQRAAELEAALILSYPTNGLALKAADAIECALRKWYSSVEIARCLSHQHSSLGGSKGYQKSDVTEMLYLATHNG